MTRANKFHARAAAPTARGIGLAVRQRAMVRVCCLLAACGLLAAAPSRALDLSNEPMETKVLTIPANLMFVLDNSGSMDWELMTRNTEGVGSWSEYYLYHNNDNHYGNVLSNDGKFKWLNRWWQWNTVYYNPGYSYRPWPSTANYTFPNIDFADLKAVPSNPSHPNDNLKDLTRDDWWRDVRCFHPKVLILDNNDYRFSASEAWTHQPTDDWDSWLDDYYYVHDTNDEAGWFFRVSSAGSYDVFTWVPEAYNWYHDNESCWKVTDTTGETGCIRVDQENDTGEWRYLGTYSFDPEQDAIVTVERDDQGTNSSTVADAILVVPHGMYVTFDFIDVPLMHYFTWTDLNQNGVTEVGEVYLVVLRRDSGSGDPAPEDFVREVYAAPVSYYGENSSDDKTWLYYLTGPLDDEDIPPGVIARLPDANGEMQKASPSQEVQNFANWYAYFRRRMFVTKYAVAKAITDFEFVNVGFYTINNVSNSNVGDRIGVLPIHVDGPADEQPTIVVDNKDSGFSIRRGSWEEATYADDQEFNQSSEISKKCSYFGICSEPGANNPCEDWVRRKIKRWETCGYSSASECTDDPGWKWWCNTVAKCTYNAKRWMVEGYNSKRQCKADGHSENWCNAKPIYDEGYWWEVNGYPSLDACLADNDIYWEREGYASYDDCVRSNCNTAAELGARATARWTPNIPATGDYKIYVTYAADLSADKQACYKVKHYYGTTGCITVDQTVGGGKFHLLTDADHPDGVFTLYAGSGNYVELARSAAPTITDNGYFSNADAVMFEPQVGTVNLDSTDDLLDALYSDIQRAAGTPLRSAVYKVARYFDVPDTGGFNPEDEPTQDRWQSKGSTPYYSVPEGPRPDEGGGECQQAFMVVMTDGYYNGGFSSVGNVDGSVSDPLYGDPWSNTLADITWKYWDKDLAPSLPDEMPTNNYDKNPTQHLVTYSVSLGVEGSIPMDDMNRNGIPDVEEDFNGDGEPDNLGYSTDPYFLNLRTPRPHYCEEDDCSGSDDPIHGWPRPHTDDVTAIDDLWHCSVNGHGEFFSAKDPDQLVTALWEISKNLKERISSGSSVSVNGEELNSGTVLYQATYEAGTWVGDVTAYRIDNPSGYIDREEGHELWKASAQLQDLLTSVDSSGKAGWERRKLITTDGLGATNPFIFDDGDTDDLNELSFLQKQIVGSGDVVNFIRGQENIPGFRKRKHLLGDIVHSAPLLVPEWVPASDLSEDGLDNDGDGQIDEAGENYADGLDNDYDGKVDEYGEMKQEGVIFAGGNDGILHAFDANTGEERFGYVPNVIFDHLRDLTNATYEHRFYVDLTPYLAEMNFHAGDRSRDNMDNDGDGRIDEADEDYGNNADDDLDGVVDEPDEKFTIKALVGGLARGGKGVYCLNITNANALSINSSYVDFTEGVIDLRYGRRMHPLVLWEYPPYEWAGDLSGDGKDSDGDGYVDEADEDHSDGIDNDGDGAVDDPDEHIIAYVPAGNNSTDPFDTSNNHSDGIDNDGDGKIDEYGEMKVTFADDDLGYTYSHAYIVASNRSFQRGSLTDHPYVAIFGNGYGSVNGSAVLYVLDAMTGEMVRKIDTGAKGNNGLSSPALVDADSDGIVDYAYAGDLQGNMWKFDLTSTDPREWGVAYGEDNYNPAGTDVHRIDAADDGSQDGVAGVTADVPRPLIQIPGQPITMRPEVAYHCELHGYMVMFGTGRYLGETDISDNGLQSIFGVWDFGDDQDDDEYLGVWNREENKFYRYYNSATDNEVNPLLSDGTHTIGLLRQKIVYEAVLGHRYIRVLSGHIPHYYLPRNDGTTTVTVGGKEYAPGDVIYHEDTCVKNPDGSCKQATDPYGNPRTDENGNPVYVYEHANPWLDTDWMDSNGIDDDGDLVIDGDDIGCDAWYNEHDSDPTLEPSYVCVGDQIDETEATNHVGWYFDLGKLATDDGVDNDNDGETDEAGELEMIGERSVKDAFIREGKLIILTFTPNDSPCSGGGTSILMEMSVCNGGRLNEPVFDLNNDKKITDDYTADPNDTLTGGSDLININEGVPGAPPLWVAPTGIEFQGMLHPPIFLRMPDSAREMKIFSSSSGTTEVVFETVEKLGVYFWKKVR